MAPRIQRRGAGSSEEGENDACGSQNLKTSGPTVIDLDYLECPKYFKSETSEMPSNSCNAPPQPVNTAHDHRLCGPRQMPQHGKVCGLFHHDYLKQESKMQTGFMDPTTSSSFGWPTV